MKVYVVEKGFYSDRSIVAVVETKEEAEKLVKAFGGKPPWRENDTSYTEYDTKKFVSGLIRYQVDNYSGEWTADPDVYDLYKGYKENACDYEGHYIIYANSPEQAEKIAQDMYAEEEARKQGIT